MALRQILLEGDPALLKKSRKVTNFDERLHILIDDMRETLMLAEGLGLAAPQVGVLRSVVLVVDINKEDLTPEEQIVELINPEIVEVEGRVTGPEGCLSMPDLTGIVMRPAKVKVKAFDRFGKQFEIEGTGITARALCHETDHLDGTLFTDLATRVFDLKDDRQVEAYNRYMEEKNAKEKAQRQEAGQDGAGRENADKANN